MNKYVTQTIANLQNAGFTVKAWADSEYFSPEDVSDYSDYSLVAFKDGVNVGGIYIVAENEGESVISDYALCLEQYISRESDTLSQVTVVFTTDELSNVIQALHDRVDLLEHGFHPDVAKRTFTLASRLVALSKYWAGESS